MTKKIVSTKQIVLAAMLTALSLLIAYSPFKLPLPQPFSVTIASHVPTIIAMFISPWVAVCTVIGSAVGFMMATGNPIIMLRAASHIFFVLVGLYMLRKRCNPYLTLALTSIVHALSEALVILLFSNLFGIAIPVSKVGFVLLPFVDPLFGYLFNAVFVIVVFHHFADSLISVLVLIPLEKARLIGNTGLFKRKR